MEPQNDILDVLIDLIKQGYQVKFKQGWFGTTTFQIELYKDSHHVAKTISIDELRLTTVPKAEIVLTMLRRLIWEYETYIKNLESERFLL